MIFSIFVISFVLSYFLFKEKYLKTALSNVFFGIVGLIVGVFYNFKKIVLKDGFKNTENKKFDIFSFSFLINKFCVYLPVAMLLLIPIGIFGGHEIQNSIEDFFELFFSTEEFAAIFFLFAMPISFLISTSTLLLKKIISSTNVSLETRKLLSELLIIVVNIFQFILFVASIILFIATGIVGWIVGILVAVILLLFVLKYKYDDKKLKIILSKSIFIFIMAGFFNIIVGLLAFFTVYPYLISIYFLRNIEKMSDYYKEKENEKSLSANQDLDVLKINQANDISKVIIYSLLFVIIYVVLDILIKFFIDL